MRRIIANDEEDIVVPVHKLSGYELIAYKCPDSSAICVLTKLSNCNYGFIPINDSNSVPRFLANSRVEAISNVAKQRKLFCFRTQDELVEAIYNKKFI